MTFISTHKAAVSRKFGHCYILHDFFDALWSNYYSLFWKKKFPIKTKQGVNNCFKPLILSVFTAVASRLKFQITNVNFVLVKYSQIFFVVDRSR